MRNLCLRFSKAVGMVAAVAAVGLPAAAVLMTPSPEAAVGAVTPTTQSESLATLLTGGALQGEESAAISPVGAMLIASTVSADYGGPPYYYFGDVNGDGTTNLVDFAILKSNFGTVGPTAVRGTGDLTGDFIVGFDDFLVVKFFFGLSSPYIP
jgi:hypothetical protein